MKPENHEDINLDSLHTDFTKSPSFEEDKGVIHLSDIEKYVSEFLNSSEDKYINCPNNPQEREKLKLDILEALRNLDDIYGVKVSSIVDVSVYSDPKDESKILVSVFPRKVKSRSKKADK